MTASRALAAHSASTRARSSSRVPTAAPTRRRPPPSALQAARLGRALLFQEARLCCEPHLHDSQQPLKS